MQTLCLADKKIGAINTDGIGLVYYSGGLTGTPLTIWFRTRKGLFPVINVTVGPDKNIWFTNNSHSQLGKLKLPIK